MTYEVNTQKFMEIRAYIRRKKNQGVTYDQLRQDPFTRANRGPRNLEDDASFKVELQSLEDELFGTLDDPVNVITMDYWNWAIARIEDYENSQIEIQSNANSTIVPAKATASNAIILQSEDSMWKVYSNYLLSEKNFPEMMLEIMEKETFEAVRNLSSDTTSTDAVKGMVVGYVQSGKTANMAALMSMAADNGFNFFLILSGTIENLRLQTQERLTKDLVYQNNQTHMQWACIERLKKNSPSHKLETLNFERNVYFSVCLKNVSRLKGVLDWLSECESALPKMKLLVIDDEADQASINTKTNPDLASANDNEYNQTKINDLITNIIDNKNKNGTPHRHKIKAVNYVMYTATPYANFLNESFKESLYPRSFIRTLTPSQEYIGAKQIFGSRLVGANCEADGLDIVREIPAHDLESLATLDDGIVLPASLKKAVVWFLLGTSARRVWGQTGNSSMLVHESMRVSRHELLSKAVVSFLRNEKEAIMEMAKDLWNYETSAFTLKNFENAMPYYTFDGKLDYPAFESLQPHITKLLTSISPMSMNSENELLYHDGIHIVVDNSNNNGVIEGEYRRLVYPVESTKHLSRAFIVFGGNTLSRGLTIEGLISTYFIRGTKLGDSLMQMGRWFGYRKHYELLPRIWMDETTREKFEYLTSVEEDMRKDLVRFGNAGVSPSQYGPHIKNTANASWLRITAKNKMQAAIEVDMNFAETNTQLVVFKNELATINHNLRVTEDFVARLNERYLCKESKNNADGQTTAVYWEKVNFDEIISDFLSKMHFDNLSIFFGNIDNLKKWMEKVEEELDVNEWNVVVAGIKPSDDEDKNWRIGNVNLGKVTRTRRNLNDEGNRINIGVLRGPRDLYADVALPTFTQEQTDEMKTLNIDVKKSISDNKLLALRRIANLDMTPQLLIYRIDKDSKARTGVSGTREDLNAKGDLIGISIFIPGMGGMETESKLTVKINAKDLGDEE